MSLQVSVDGELVDNIGCQLLADAVRRTKRWVFVVGGGIVLED